ncbi:hypothetical protein VCSRO46_3430 [Vibrio cholerae]|nr:hypothetical protein FXE36_02440 [Vibrio cholerae]GIB52586.1 hypothetical protein VCSRO46_3430 [Vibrio cholerae]
MRITSTHLSHWSDERRSQESLPILVRRLISATSTVNAMTMPGGDSVNLPGWDGVISVQSGNPWVPDGLSYWEMGTSKDTAAKAQSDYAKRTEQLQPEHRAVAAFVFITPRRWAGKDNWLSKIRSENQWARVLVWDADDLEAWLESSATTSLWFGAQIGINGYGVVAIEQYWSDWQGQSNPAITYQSLVTGREQSGLALKNAFDQRESFIAVVADSQSEAVAFVCGALLEHGYSNLAACVTSEEGWQFVDSNSGIGFVVVAENQLSNRKAPRDGMTLVVPLAAGDREFNLKGIGLEASQHTHIELRRPRSDEFENALLNLGLDRADAARFSRSMGRSWTVFRRQFAVNPIIKKPMWLSATNTIALQVLTLVGAWNSRSEGDRLCVEHLANRAYEEVENDLIELAALDDAPVIKIGSLWKAKAPLELLNLMAPKLTDAVLTRFFNVAKSIYEELDPVLELEESERWMASIYGKVRAQSGVILDGIADSIAKLGYFSEVNDELDIAGRHVRGLVRHLLFDANEQRWLSVSSYLREFAEAAPHEFIGAVEQSLRSPTRSVVSLLSETSAAGVHGRCWHANLLWALELLAWYPTRLNKVALILAELSKTEIKGNWGNTPFSSLLSLFRPWMPQTSAPQDARIKVIKNVIARFPDIGWQLLVKLTPRGNDWASPNAKPSWRDDDSGVGNGVSQAEYCSFVLTAGSILVEMALGSATRIAELVPVVDSLDESFRDSVITLVKSAYAFCDNDKDLVRSEVRKYLNWENSFNQNGESHDRYAADALRPIYDGLTPNDLILRHKWLFSSGWIELPDGRENDREETQRFKANLQVDAFNEIFDCYGWPGITKLAEVAGDCWLIGKLIAECSARAESAEWISNWYLSRSNTGFDALTSGALNCIDQRELSFFLTTCISTLSNLSVSAPVLGGFLVNAPQTIELWQRIGDLDEGIRDHFWDKVTIPYLVSSPEVLTFCVEKLLVANRPRAAIQTIHGREAELSSELIIRVLNQLASGSEEAVDFPQSWHIADLFEVLHSRQLHSELLTLEFTYYEVLHNSKYGTPNLYTELVTNPDIFIELVCLVYKPANSEREPLSEQMLGVARTASSVLYDLNATPGINSSGLIDENKFCRWVSTVRRMAQEHDRQEVTDRLIGKMLADWPCKKSLEMWPEAAISTLLEQDDAEEIRAGFSLGVRNSRGGTTRMPYDGGSQERTVAQKFREYAAYWDVTHPTVAALICEIARYYDFDAKRMDEDGLWNQEA